MTNEEIPRTDHATRARALLDSLPEFEGTLEEAFEKHEADERESMRRKGWI